MPLPPVPGCRRRGCPLRLPDLWNPRTGDSIPDEEAIPLQGGEETALLAAVVRMVGVVGLCHGGLRDDGVPPPGKEVPSRGMCRPVETEGRLLWATLPCYFLRYNHYC